MVKADLARWLDEGRSLQDIAGITSKHPSTVGYWVAKHGLVAAHRDRHTARGGLDRAALEALIEAGYTTRRIAAEFGVSQTTVAYWLRRHDLRTQRAVRNRALREALVGADEEPEVGCPRHGSVRHVRVDGRGLRCASCRVEAVRVRRRKIKQLLVAEAGGRCFLCGYDQFLGALHFHHLDRATKEFHLAYRGATRSIERARAEARKCVLLCSNCHAEVEGGIVTLPAKIDLRAADSPR